MQDILAAISQVGFPIGITVYLLVSFEKKLNSLTSSIQELSGQIEDLIKCIERGQK